MPKIPLTIDVNYLPTWKAWEGIRELVQNARDAEQMHGAKMMVTHHGGSNTLIIQNDGVELPHKALLLGATTKVGNAKAIGQFGEGLKLGILALVRANHPVTIRTGQEVWVPTIEESAQFKTRVLTFDIRNVQSQAYASSIRIEIGEVEYEAWVRIRSCFTFLDEHQEEDKVVTDKGSLLLDPSRKGQIYVKGIFVKNHPKAEFGYDLLNAQVDRDRRMIGDFDLQFEIAWIWHRAVAARPDLFPRFVETLTENQSLESKSYDDSPDFMAQHTPEEIKKQLVAAFVDKHGTGVLPATTTEQTAMIVNAGLRSVIVPKGLLAAMTSILGTPEDQIEEYLNCVDEVINWSDLLSWEQDNWNRALELAAVARGREVRDRCDIVTFRSVRLNGLHDGKKDGRISIGRHRLISVEKCLCTMLHEIAHDYGADGDPDHVGAMQELWTTVVGELLKEKS